MADHHSAKLGIPAEMNTQGAAFGIFSANLEVLPHLNSLAVVGERSSPTCLRIPLNRLGLAGGIAVSPEDLTSHHVWRPIQLAFAEGARKQLQQLKQLAAMFKPFRLVS